LATENDQLISISEQAAHWWVVFRDGDDSPAARREFAEWVVRSPERVEAYLRVAQVQGALARPDLRWPETSADVLIRDSIASRKDPVPLRRQWFSQKSASAGRRPGLLATAGIAASLLVAVLLGWFTLPRTQQFQTKFGEQRSVLLADGSRVTLNTASTIQVRLRADRRSVYLVRGEALFEAAHDMSRPFEVHVGNAVLRAIGTQFNVDLRTDRTVVTVVEGRVAVVGENGKSPDPRLPILSAADRLVIGRAGAGVPEHGVNVDTETAWTHRQLVFERRPLGEVAEEFNRYNLGRIEIRSPALRTEEVTGTFQSNDPASFISFLEGIPGVQIIDDGKGGRIVTMEKSSGARDQ
jgi:transmembrane sensor